MRAVQRGRPIGRKNVDNNLARIWRWTKNLAGTTTVVVKRTEVTIETNQVVLIRSRQQPVRSWCPECRREVDMIDLKEVESLTGTTQPMLSSSGGDRRWHWSQAEDGSSLVCLESLLKSR
jgi:hypothetical protein